MISFITSNRGKFEEMRAVLPELLQLDLEVPEIQSLDAAEILRAKLDAAKEQHSGALIVEDTSLVFEGLNGLPGPLIKWFLDSLGVAGLAKLAEQIGNDRARTTTLIGYTDAEGLIELFEGSLTGVIVKPRGDKDFGWGSVFQPDGQTKTFGQMDKPEKLAISPRGLAAQKLKTFLDQQIVQDSSEMQEHQ